MGVMDAPLKLQSECSAIRCSVIQLPMWFTELGTDTTTAIRIFLTQAVAANGFPFEIKKTMPSPYIAMSEEELLQKLELSRNHAKQGKLRDADDVISDMREKNKFSY